MGNLASAVDELLSVDVREAPAAQLQDEVEEILRQRNRLDAAYLQRLCDAYAEHFSRTDGPPIGVDPQIATTDEI